MFTNSVFTGSKLLDRIQKVSALKHGTTYEEIGLITPHAKDSEPFFVISDNKMDRIGTVSRKEIKQALSSGKID